MTDLNHDVLALPARELTIDDLECVAGGSRTEKIHIDYHRMDNFNDPTAVRYC